MKKYSLSFHFTFYSLLRVLCFLVRFSSQLIPGYRGFVIDSLRKLLILDDLRVTSDEKHYFRGLARRKGGKFMLRPFLSLPHILLISNSQKLSDICNAWSVSVKNFSLSQWIVPVLRIQKHIYLLFQSTLLKKAWL